MATDYLIGVKIILANGVSPVLAVIAKDLLGVSGSVEKLAKDFSGLNSKLIGVAAILGGAAILGAMTEIAKKAADFQDAMTAVSQLNPKVAALVQSGEIQKQAFGIGNQLGMKVEDVTKIYGGVYGAIQNPEEATEILPYASRYARLMQLRHPGSHPEESIRTLVRAGELSGRLYDDKGNIDPAKVREWFDMAAISNAATHGQVNAESLYGMAQQAGPGSLRNLSKEGYEHMMILSQEMGGQRSGTALLSLRNQMTGGMLKRSAEALQNYGVLQDGEWNSEGGHVSLTQGATDRLMGLLRDDPVKFVDMLVEKLEKQGVTDKSKQMEAVNQMIGRQTSQRFVQDIMAQRQQINRETAGLDQGATVDQGLAGYENNINRNLQNMSAAWSNLMVAIGGPQGENFVKVLQSITGVLNSATSFANAHPEAIKIIAEAVAALGIALVGAGAAALIAAAGVPAIIVGLVAAAGALVAVNWTSIVSAFHGITGAISGFIDQIMALYSRVKGFFGGTPENQQIEKRFREDAPIVIPNRFVPNPNSGKRQSITLALNVDGRALAQSVQDNLDADMIHTTSAPSPDGVHSYYSGDHNAVTT